MILNKENITEVDEVIETYCSARNIKIFDPTFYVVLSMFRTIAILEKLGVKSMLDIINGNESIPPKLKILEKTWSTLAKAISK